MHTHIHTRTHTLIHDPCGSNHYREQVFLKGCLLITQDLFLKSGSFPAHKLEEKREVGTFENTVVPERQI